MHPWLKKIAVGRVLVLGDAMLDRYYFADVTRISPEGPVPVALVKAIKNTLGGAANVAHNLARLGCRVALAGISGDDENHRALEGRLDALGISHTGLIRTERPTTTKVRVMGGHQQMLRVDFENIEPISLTLEKQLIADFREELGEGVDAVILSDYAKGVCSAGLCRAVIRLCREAGVPLVVDPKGDRWQKYKGAFLVTPNVKELSEACRQELHNDDRHIVSMGEAIRQRFDFGALLVTRSEKGLSLLAGGEPVHIPTYAREVFDVSGAGDTVAAVMGAALAAKLNLKTAAHLANLAAGVVVAKIGTYAISAVELDAALSQVPNLKEWEQ